MNDVSIEVKEKLQRFNKDILEDINGERQEMLDKAEKELAEYYEKKENEYLKEAHDNIQAALREIKRKNQVKRSKIIMQHRMELLEKRNSIIEKIYFEASKKLVAFTKTDKYKDFILNKLAHIKEVIGDELEVTISYNDRDLKGFIEDKAGVKVAVADKKRELIGGLICYSSKRGILVDESFSKILSDKKEDILKICNLQVD